MPKRIYIIASVVLLAAFISLLLNVLKTQREDNNEDPQADAPRKSSPSTSQLTQETKNKTKLERENQNSSRELREIEKKFDEILPALFPEQPSTLCDTQLEPGNSLVVGGFKNSEDDFEFTKILVETIEAGDGSQSYRIKAVSFNLSREKSMEFGLDPLISPAKTRIQKTLTIPGNLSESLQSVNAAIAYPSVIALSGEAATISIGKEEFGRAISVLATSTDDEKFIRLRMRLESTAGRSPE